MVARGFRRIPTKVSLTFDIADCGPRNQFVVQGSDGPLIVHNCNGAMYRQREENGPRDVVHIHDIKLDALDSILEEAGRDPVLLAYSFKHDLARIKKRFPFATVFESEPDFVKKWNKGKIRLALAHPASIGHGLNIQFGGHIAVWFGLNWSLELFQQFNARLPRSGQPHPCVFSHRLIMKNTVDETVVSAMTVKGASQDSVNAAVKARVLTKSANYGGVGS